MKTLHKPPEQQKHLINRQARRWEKQHQKILLAAGRLFWKKGYLGTSIEDIAKTADMSKGTIYYYFPNKPALLYEIMLTPLKEFIDLGIPIANSNLDSEAKLKALITNHIMWQSSNPGFAGMGHVERKNLPPVLRHKYLDKRDEYEHLYRKTIKEGINRGEFSFRDAKLATLFTLGLINSIYQWYRAKGDYSIEGIISEVSAYACTALKMG